MPNTAERKDDSDDCGTRSHDARPQCVKEDQTLVEAARLLRDLDVGAMPICGNDDRLKGMLTDRDIVVKCIAEGGDPNTATAGSLAEGKPVTIGADDDIREALEVMQDHQVRRLDEGLVLLHALGVGRHEIACHSHRSRPFSRLSSACYARAGVAAQGLTRVPGRLAPRPTCP